VKIDVQFPSVVGPRPELHVADLDIEREVLDVDGARRAKDGGRKPQHVALVTDHSHRVAVLLQPSVGAVPAGKTQRHNRRHVTVVKVGLTSKNGLTRSSADV